MLKPPVSARPQKLNSDEPVQYFDGWLLKQHDACVLYLS